VTFRSRAPLRISFAGGGTDVSPYLEQRGGAVLCASINAFATASFEPRVSKNLTIKSVDFDITEEHAADSILPLDGRLDIAKCVVNRLGERNLFGEMTLRVDAPPGSGLGSSSALTVAAVGLLREMRSLPMSEYEVADLAFDIERRELGMIGGKQDQYAASFGGFNFIEFRSDATIVTPLRIRSSTINELESSLLFCFTKRTRDSGSIIEDQIANVNAGNSAAIEAMDMSKAIAVRLRDALLQNDLRSFSTLLDEAWHHKRNFAARISNDFLDETYAKAKEAGAISGKVSGAGGGGFMFFFVPWERKHRVADYLTAHGVEIANFGFHAQGLETWTTASYPEQ
jgi:D-glycero-alpha-D-manno-heptose-7-phosphate kinase